MDFVTTDDMTTSDMDFVITKYDNNHYVVGSANLIDVSLMVSVFIGVLLALLVSNLLFGGGTR